MAAEELMLLQHVLRQKHQVVSVCEAMESFGRGQPGHETLKKAPVDWGSLEVILSAWGLLHVFFCIFVYPLVNRYISIENPHFQWENPL